MFVVTGASGHLGHHITKYLLDEGYEVKLLTRQTVSFFERNTLMRVGSLLDEAFLKAEISRGDIIIHAAGYIDLHNLDKEKSYESNVLTTKMVAERCRYTGARLIYISTTDVIKKNKEGLIEEPVELIEDDPTDFYASTKLEATHYVRSLIKAGLSGMILYPSAIISPNDYKNGPISREIRAVLRKKLLFSVKGGYNFIDASDVSKAVCAAALKSYNDEFILSGSNLSIQDLYKRIIRITNQRKFILYVPNFIAKRLIPHFKQYSLKMLEVIQENHRYNNHKMKQYLVETLKPFDLSLSETILFLKSYQANAPE